MAVITKTTPDLFFKFMEVVSSFQPCTKEQIRKGMKEVWGPVYSARNFALEYKFISFDEKNRTFSLTTDGQRLLRFSGNLRNDFLINSYKLQCHEPFSSIQNELSRRNTMNLRDLGDFVQTRFLQKEKPTVENRQEYGKALADWLVFLRVAERKDDIVAFVKGEVKTTGIIYFPEMERLLDRTLYDFLVENFHTPHNIFDEPHGLLEKVNQTKDDNNKGELFESFIGAVFKRLGFSPRLKDGARESSMRLTLKRSGGGDLVLFCHFPFCSEKEILEGYAIACEAKAQEGVIGSKAIGQARNLCKKIQEAYPRYLVHTLVLSQSAYGYDQSGREQAPPEVLHVTSKVILSILDVQKKRLEKGLSLVTPVHIMHLFEELVRRQDLEPKPEITIEILEGAMEK